MLATQPTEFHEVAGIFPLMDGKDFDDLKSDILAHGLIEPVWTYEGKIIDGRNRYRACRELGIEPDFREWRGGDPTAFVVSLNLHRRHLTESQRAMVAARAKKQFEAGSQARREATQFASSSPTDVANLPPPQNDDAGKSRDKAADLLNVSPRSVESASKVLKNGTPDLVKAVDQGEVKVSAAAAVAGLPADEQEATLAQGPLAVREKAREVRQEKAAVHLPGQQALFETEPEEKADPDGVAAFWKRMERARDELRILLNTAIDPDNAELLAAEVPKRTRSALMHCMLGIRDDAHEIAQQLRKVGSKCAPQ